VAAVTSTISIRGFAEPVFDLITSARFWPEWHPATRAVFGVTQRPYGRSDVIHEFVQFGGTDLVVSWRVAEHVRPSRVVLEALTARARIAYSFDPSGDAIEFRRDLEYDEPLVRQIAPAIVDLHGLMQEQSEEALRRLKELVERILRDEQAPAPDIDGL
jgi:Polyketide cyclase / dehydrase and lipid transport